MTGLSIIIAINKEINLKLLLFATFGLLSFAGHLTKAEAIGMLPHDPSTLIQQFVTTTELLANSPAAAPEHASLLGGWVGEVAHSFQSHFLLDLAVVTTVYKTKDLLSLWNGRFWIEKNSGFIRTGRGNLIKLRNEKRFVQVRRFPPQGEDASNHTALALDNHGSVYLITDKPFRQKLPYVRGKRLGTHWGRMYLITNDDKVLQFRENDLLTNFEFAGHFEEATKLLPGFDLDLEIKTWSRDLKISKVKKASQITPNVLIIETESGDIGTVGSLEKGL